MYSIWESNQGPLAYHSNYQSLSYPITQMNGHEIHTNCLLDYNGSPSENLKINKNVTVELHL